MCVLGWRQSMAGLAGAASWPLAQGRVRTVMSVTAAVFQAEMSPLKAVAYMNTSCGDRRLVVMWGPVRVGVGVAPEHGRTGWRQVVTPRKGEYAHTCLSPRPCSRLTGAG